MVVSQNREKLTQKVAKAIPENNALADSLRVLELQLSCWHAQSALVWLGLLNFTMFAIHVEQAMSDKRFVSSRDSTDPHPSRTLRFTRFLDIAVTFVLGAFLVPQAFNLYMKRLDPMVGSIRLKMCMLSVTMAYFFGAGADFVQCHYQAGGVGSQCNGYSCLHVSGAFLIALAVLWFHGRIFIAFCLFSQSVYRLLWLSRLAGVPDRWSSMVMIWVVVLGIYPLVLHYTQLFHTAEYIYNTAHEEVMIRILQFVTSNRAESESRPARSVHSQRKCGRGAEGRTDLKTLSTSVKVVDVVVHGDVDTACRHKQSDPGESGDQKAADLQVIVKDEAVQERIKEDEYKVSGLDARGAVHTINSPEIAAHIQPRHGSESTDSVSELDRVFMLDSDEECDRTAPSCASMLPGTGRIRQDKISRAQRARERRDEQNGLIAALDQLLPEEARTRAFKGAV